MKNRLITLTGLPYAGKTTLRTAIASKFGHKVISIDDINTELGVGIDPEIEITQADWNRTYKEAYERLKNYLKKGESVIFDGGSLLKHERQMQKQIASSLNVPTFLVYVSIPIDEIKKRWTKNQQTKKRGHVREDDFRRALEMFEEPTSDEFPILYTNELDVDKWIEKNL